MKNYNEIAEELFERREAYNAAKKRKQRFVKRTAAALSCVCIAVLAAVTFGNNIHFGSDGVKSQPGTSVPEKENHGGTETMTVTEYKAGAETLTDYKAPENGDFYCYKDVEAAREHYKGEDAVFVLGIDIFSDEAMADEEQKAAEYKRLKELGYTFYEIETFSFSGDGIKMPESVMLVQLTEGQLKAFEPSPEYGYAFRFVHNGDGSDINFGNAERVEDF